MVATTHDWVALAIRCGVAVAVVFLPCSILKNKDSLESLDREVDQSAIRWNLLAAHFCALITAVKLSTLLYSEGGLQRVDLLTAAWLIATISAIGFVALTFLPPAIWSQLIRRTGLLWGYASIAVISAIAVGPFLRRSLWAPTISLTFELTKIILRLFVPEVVANAHTMVIGTPEFRVQILPGCSGVEGIGLILAFGLLWLFVFRKECRFPQSLALLPLGVIVIFLFNAIRIAALILIGNAGAEEIAVNGFHSQAGWIAFVLVSIGFCSVAQTVPWFSTKPQRKPGILEITQNPTAAYLMPFLMILIAGTIATAATSSDGFEWLYPLRFFAALATLWIFRRSYANLNWKVDWLGPATGVLVFGVWVALDYFSHPANDDQAFVGLLASSMAVRISWILVRVLAAVITVPLAEELAFRGFLMRRLISSDFESVSFQRLNWFALLSSSIIFGILHGGFWLAGIIAGVLFALVTIRKGRMGNAVVAHATANALLAGYVLAFQKWHLW